MRSQTHRITTHSCTANPQRDEERIDGKDEGKEGGRVWGVGIRGRDRHCADRAVTALNYQASTAHWKQFLRIVVI